MNLYLFPEAACHINGYGIGVEAAYKRLNIKDEDVVVWFTTVSRDKMLLVRDYDYIIKRPKLLSFRSVINTIRRTNRSEPFVSDLSFLRGRKFDVIYCDETWLYHPIRKLFPDEKLIVRFHNSFARIHDRLNLLPRKVDFLYKWTLYNMYHLERDVMNDANVYKIFISDEDRYYYTSHYGKTSDSENFGYAIDERTMLSHRKKIEIDNRLIWYGGVESHKKAAIEWFIDSVLPQIRIKFPETEFHLWGSGTLQFNNPSIGVYGHGFYEGNDMPSTSSLYINPDIIGGGIKLKMKTLLENGVPVISSPFGFEGYNYDLVDNDYCIVQEEELWADFICTYFNKYLKR